MTVAIPLGLFIVLMVFSFFIKKAYSLHEIHLFFPLAWTIIYYFFPLNHIIWITIGICLWLRFIKWLIEYIISRHDPNFTTFWQVHKLKKAGRYPGQIDLEKTFPQLSNNPAYIAIYNHCQNEDEQEEFLFDWNEYSMDLQQEVIFSPDIPPENIYYSFDEWYVKNERWKDTKYHHLYYSKQAQEYYNAD